MAELKLRKNEKGMILAIDMGNTNIVIGCVDDKKVLFEERLSTDYSKTELEYAIEGAIISSVVPQLVNIIKAAVEKTVGITPLMVGPGIKTGLNILMDQPRQVGTDMIVDAVATLNGYGAPAIIIDMGTATTISVVDEKENYIGGVILPGIRVSVDSLVSRTAQLPRISLDTPKSVMGKNTIDCMKSGVIYGNASCIDGMLDRIIEANGFGVNGKPEAKVVATGGLAKVIVPHCKHNIHIDAELLLKGLRIIYDKNVEGN